MDPTTVMFGGILIVIFVTMGPMWFVIFMPFMIMAVMWEFGEWKDPNTNRLF